MFGLGSKKHKTPVLPWTFQILTTEYLIEGQMPSDDEFYGNIQVYDPADYLETFVQVQIQPTGLLAVSTQALPNWHHGFGQLIVALIPRDEDNIQTAREAYENFTYVARGQLFTGPYLVQGKLMSDTESTEFFFREQSGYLPMTDVEITHLMPGAKLRGCRVPWMLINGDGVHGYSLL